MDEKTHNFRRCFVEELGQCFNSLRWFEKWSELLLEDDFSDERLLQFIIETEYPGDPNEMLEIIQKGLTLPQYLANLYDQFPKNLVSENVEPGLLYAIIGYPEGFFNRIMDCMTNQENREFFERKFKENGGDRQTN